MRATAASWSAKDAAERVGMSYALIDSYARKDKRVLLPSVQEGHGRGRRRAYSFQDLVALRVADELRSIGISTNVIREVAACVQNEIKSIGCEADVARLGQVWVTLSSAMGRVGTPVVTSSLAATDEALPLALRIDVTSIARQLAGLRGESARSRPPRSGG